MAKTPYRSAVRSERLLREAYVTLRKQGDRISVAALCRAADLNRSTFYVHYDSVEALERDVLDHVMAELAETLEGAMATDYYEDPYPLVTAIGAYVERNQEMLRFWLTSEEAFDFGADLRRTLLALVGDRGPKEMVVFDYTAGGLASIYRSWLVGDYADLPIDQVGRIAADLVKYG